MNISFNIDNHDELSMYNNQELNLIAKQLFYEWFSRKYKTSDLSDQLIQHQNKISLDFNEKFSTIKNELDNLSKTTKDIFGLAKTSQKRGEILEHKIFDYFENNIKHYTVNKTNHIPHHADAELILNNNKYLLEIKNYNTTVDTKEIEKLKFDMEYCNIKYALFLSVQSSIVGKKTIDIEQFNNNNYIVYVSYILDEPHKIDSGLSILEILSRLNSKNNIDDIVLNSMKEISFISDVITSLRKQYNSMESKIKEQLNDFYVNIRENELLIKNKINLIWKNININDTIEYLPFDNILINNKNNLELIKLFDIFTKFNIKLIAQNDSSYLLSHNIELKLFNKKIEIHFTNPKITIKFLNNINNDENYDFLISLLNLKKISSHLQIKSS
jgi:hypothetical protein